MLQQGPHHKSPHRGRGTPAGLVARSGQALASPPASPVPLLPAYPRGRPPARRGAETHLAALGLRRLVPCGRQGGEFRLGGSIPPSPASSPGAAARAGRSDAGSGCENPASPKGGMLGSTQRCLSAGRVGAAPRPPGDSPLLAPRGALQASAFSGSRHLAPARRWLGEVSTTGLLLLGGGSGGRGA